VPWSPACCWQGLLVQSPHIRGEVSDDQEKSLTHDAELHLSPEGPQEALPARPHFFWLLPRPCSRHSLLGSGWVHTRFSRKSLCHSNESQGFSPVLGPQEAAAGCASCIPGFFCCHTTGEERVSADFPW